MGILLALFITSYILCATNTSPTDREFLTGGHATWHVTNAIPPQEKTRTQGVHIFCIDPLPPLDLTTHTDLIAILNQQNPGPQDLSDSQNIICVSAQQTTASVKVTPEKHAFKRFLTFAISQGIYPGKSACSCYQHMLDSQDDLVCNKVTFTAESARPFTEIVQYHIKEPSSESSECFFSVHCFMNPPFLQIILHRDAQVLQTFRFRQQTHTADLQVYKGLHTSWVSLPSSLTKCDLPLAKRSEDVWQLIESLHLTGAVVAYCPRTPDQIWKKDLNINLACILHTEQRDSIIWITATTRATSSSQKPLVIQAFMQNTRPFCRNFLTHIFPELGYLTPSYGLQLNFSGLHDAYLSSTLPSLNSRLEIAIAGTSLLRIHHRAYIIKWIDGQPQTYIWHLPKDGPGYLNTPKEEQEYHATSLPCSIY